MTSRREVYTALIQSAHQALLAAQALCPQRVIVNQMYMIQELERTLHSLQSGKDEPDADGEAADGDSTLPDLPTAPTPHSRWCQIQ